MKEYYISKHSFIINIKLNDIISADVVYRILSKRELDNLYNQYGNTKKLFKVKVVECALQDKTIIDDITDKDIDKIFNSVMDKSIIVDKDINTFQKCFNLTNSNDLKSNTWKCNVCKIKKLQVSRNCPYLKKEMDDSIVIFVDGERYTSCPVYVVNENSNLMNKAYIAYNIFKSGFLPDDGGFYDQTSFFVNFSLLIDRLVKEREQKELRKSSV